MAGQLEMLKVKYEEAMEARKKAELDIEAFRPVSGRSLILRCDVEHVLNCERVREFTKSKMALFRRMWMLQRLPELPWKGDWKTWRWSLSSCRGFTKRYSP